MMEDHNMGMFNLKIKNVFKNGSVLTISYTKAKSKCRISYQLHVEK